MMASPLTYTILYWLLASAALARGEPSSKFTQKYSSAKSKVHEICATLSESSIDQSITLLFVLFVDTRFKTSFDYLWKFPRALIYSSDEDVILREREREVVISWERDPPSSRPSESGRYWDLYGGCGHRGKGCQSFNRFYMALFRLEKRFLLQIREWSLSDAWKEPFTLAQKRVRSLRHLTYFGLFRAVYIVVRQKNRDELHSQITVKRTGQTIGNQVLELTAEKFNLHHVREVFQSLELSLNRTAHFAFEFQAATISDEGTETRQMGFTTCFEVSTAVIDSLDEHDF